MSATPPPSAPRTLEQKLYQACLDSCIDGLLTFNFAEVSVRRATQNNNTKQPRPRDATTSRAVSLPLPLPTPSTQTADTAAVAVADQTLPKSPLPSPPPTPQRRKSPPLRSRSNSATMKRSALHGAPRSNSSFALQPATTPAKISLKKAAAKIVRPAGPPASAPTSSPVAAPVVAKPKEEDGHELPKPAAARFSPAEVDDGLASLKARLDKKTSLPKLELPPQKDETESALDSLFARLSSGATHSPKKLDREPKSGGVSFLTFDDISTLDTPTKTPKASATSTKMDARLESKKEAMVPTKAQEEKEVKVGEEENEELKAKVSETGDHNLEGMCKKDLQREYLKMATEYLTSLPTDEGSTATANLVKVVFLELRHSHRRIKTPGPNTPETLKARIIDAICAFVNGLPKNCTKPLTAESIEKTLEDNDGDFLQLCAKLAEENFIVLETLDDVVSLCNAVIKNIPKEEAKTKVPATASKPLLKAAAIDEPPPGKTHLSTPLSQDPVDSKSSWSDFTQEKRDNAAKCRTCTLIGVAGITSINQLQALVWGGRVDAIIPPIPGINRATVRFLTPEGCEKFFSASANGIKLPGPKGGLVLVEKTEEPNSTNDVVQNCAEGDGCRCVRVWDADDEWSEAALQKLAVGTGKINPRVVDCIKRGNIAKGRKYIEFRFANLMHALQFKRELHNDEDWEPCTIVFGKDPCDTARGVHFQDEDEDPAGFF